MSPCTSTHAKKQSYIEQLKFLLILKTENAFSVRKLGHEKATKNEINRNQLE